MKEFLKLPLGKLAELLCTPCIFKLSEAIKVGDQGNFKACEHCELKIKQWVAK